MWHPTVAKKCVSRANGRKHDDETWRRLYIRDTQEMLYEISTGDAYALESNAYEFQEHGTKIAAVSRDIERRQATVMRRMCFSLDRDGRCKHDVDMHGNELFFNFRPHDHTHILVRLASFLQKNYPRPDASHPTFGVFMFTESAVTRELMSFLIQNSDMLDELEMSRVIRSYLDMCPHWGCKIPNVELSVRGWQWHDCRDSPLYQNGRQLPNIEDITASSLLDSNSARKSAVFKYWLECDQSQDRNGVCAAQVARNVMQDYALVIHLYLGNDMAVQMFGFVPLWTFVPLRFDEPFRKALQTVGDKVHCLPTLYPVDVMGTSLAQNP